jgi:hypothetical protein
MLLPADGLLVLNGLGRAWQGAVVHHLGLLAATACAAQDAPADESPGLTWDRAARHFEDAMSQHDRIGAHPWAAHTRAAYAAALIARLRRERDTMAAEDQAAILDRARTLLDSALAVATELGMTALQERLRALQTEASVAPRRRASAATSSLLAPRFRTASPVARRRCCV